MKIITRTICNGPLSRCWGSNTPVSKLGQFDLAFCKKERGPFTMWSSIRQDPRLKSYVSNRRYNQHFERRNIFQDWVVR